VDDGGKFRFKDSMNRDAPVEPSREELIALIAAQAAEIAALRAHIAELERRLPGGRWSASSLRTTRCMNY
jgi:hypothetical protein